MSRVPAPPPAWLVKLNVALLRRGLRIGSQQLLTVTGRRTGAPRSTPVSLAMLEGGAYIVAAFADAAWVANLRAAGEGTLQQGSRVTAHRFTEVAVEDRGPILRAFLAQVRGGVRFFGPRTTEEIVASAAKYPVFRID